MTRPAYYKGKMTDFSLWIRNNCNDSKNGLSLTNIDYIFTDYKKKRLKIVEEKTYGTTELTYAQSQIFKYVDFALKNTANLDEIGGWEYEGMFIITFSNTDPDNSGEIKVNNVTTTKEKLLKFLNFEIYFKDL